MENLYNLNLANPNQQTNILIRLTHLRDKKRGEVTIRPTVKLLIWLGFKEIQIKETNIKQASNVIL